MQFEDCTFDWLYWPQAPILFTGHHRLHKITRTDRDIELLKFYGWDLPLECARNAAFPICFKKGAERTHSLCHWKHRVQGNLEEGIVIEQIVQEAQVVRLPEHAKQHTLNLCH
ncbi:Phosphatidylinositol 4-kinase gamma 3 [Camellia lanceoleosa]|uniref:Phosphatidylinositol 4-kinase gamma 3 n=1 Tax=Camellia lanceoleosa TaxID=1840588 RepID=A0ACC0FAB3_9ERIC|nr:Phosphatidylinositol 4-kinase gamma 3 [Camellia lanceoleosa]